MTKRILMIASNPATSPVTGWPIGFWWAELTHAYEAFLRGRSRRHDRLAEGW